MASRFPSEGDSGGLPKGPMMLNRGAKRKKRYPPSADRNGGEDVDIAGDAKPRHRSTRPFQLPHPRLSPEPVPVGIRPAFASGRYQGHKPKHPPDSTSQCVQQVWHTSPHHHYPKPARKEAMNPHPPFNTKRFPKEKDRSWTQSFRSLSDGELKALCSGDISAEEIANDLHKKMKSFQTTLQSRRLHANINNIVFLLSKLSTLLDGHCDNESKQYAIQVLGEALSDRCPNFHLQFKIYVQSLSNKQPVALSLYKRHSEFASDSVSNVLRLFRSLLQHIPTDSWSCLPVDELSQTISQNPEMLQYSSEMQEVVFLRDEMMKLTASRSSSGKGPKGLELEWDNTEYRDIPILPTWQEVCTPNPPTKLRANIVKGCYSDWMHYYDVQFRLLREDFIAPLRTGICGYLDGLQRRKLHDIKVYERVRIILPVFSREGTLYEIQFDASKFQKVNWEHSKRLLSGSLVGLSCDDFHNTVLFATVTNRNVEKLQEGILQVQFQSNESIMDFCNGTEFTMVESVAYYEACRHILRSLQIAETQTMPFTSYLIHNLSDKVLPPQYLRDTSPAYDLSDLLDKNSQMSSIQEHSNSKSVNVLDITQWPALNTLELDQSQYEAVQMALTQEVAVIQGPPGTGKTYIGMKIVQGLIKNKSVWNPPKQSSSPILIICFTNHALDQFLEGICNLFEEPLPKIVRVGGRSRNEKMDRFNIQKLNQDVHVQGDIWNDVKHLESERYECLDDLKIKTDEYYRCSSTIVRAEELQWYDNSEHLYQIHINTETDEEKQLSLALWLQVVTVASSIQNSSSKNRKGVLNSEKLDTPYPKTTTTDTVEQSSSFYEESTDAARLEEASNSSNAELPQTALDQGGAEVDHLTSVSDGDLIEVQGEASLEESSRLIDGESFEAVRLDYTPLEKIVWEDLHDKDQVVSTTNFDSSGTQNFEYYDDNYVVQRTMKKGFCIRSDAVNFIKQSLRLPPMSEVEVHQVKSVHKLDLQDRWRLYNYWLSRHKQYLASDLELEFRAYDQVCNRLKQAKKNADRFTLETADIVAMTTTGASKYQHILHLVKPKIVIVEEAAEVLESHIVSALNAGTQHLILIGDHKQLRPKPNNYTLAKDYKLDISLFERLVTNSFPHATLQIQHRMRPQIAQLVCPHIYQTLVNHDSVLKYDKVNGVHSNMYFIQHNFPERENENLSSHSNPHEAEFLVALCKYLLQQGYKPTQVTILVTYTGQLLTVRNLMRKDDFHGVRVSTVDNFQGEENDLILLSLVRSNSDGKVGFLKEQNRVCVALSRAKVGFYCIGNFTMLRENSLIWEEIMSDMEQKGYVGDALGLCCSNHPKTSFEAKLANDFAEYSPVGGCLLDCNYRLPCGHVCAQKCHITDSDHTEYACKKPCAIKCPEGHPCPKVCHYNVLCGVCMVKVRKLIPLCGHLQTIPCYMDPLDFKCKAKCEKKCPSGHQCPKTCSQECGECSFKVQKLLPLCGHLQSIPCYMDPLDFECKAKCEKKCPSGHQCPKTCSQECGECSFNVKKVIPECNHEMLLPCFQPPMPELCTNPCDNILSCGHPCLQECREPCISQVCRVKVVKSLSCGHTIKVQCNLSSMPVACQRPCQKLLPCKHPCKEKCSEPCTSVCKVMVMKRWPCGHKLKRRCYQAQDVNKYPCEKKCERKLNCGHICPKKCGQNCTEKCLVAVLKEYPCGHSNEVPCSSSPSTHPCQVFCKAPLSCGHQCFGKCSQCTSRRLHEPCKYTLPLERFCGHSGTVPCLGLLDTHPKKLVCQSSCPHKKCSHACLTGCEPCKEPCVWECPHHRCTKLCNEVCDRPPCNERCLQRLKCGHQCFGVCGEPCLEICPDCQGKQFAKVIKSGKFNRELTYVKLPCSHIYPTRFMDQHVDRMMQSKRVAPLSCPHCKLPIVLSYRYGNNAKQCMKEVHAVVDTLKERSTSLAYDRFDLRSLIENNAVREIQIQLSFHDIKFGKFRYPAHTRSDCYHTDSEVSKTFAPCPELTQPLLDLADQFERKELFTPEQRYVISCFINLAKLLDQSAVNDLEVVQIGANASSIKSEVLPLVRVLLFLKARKYKLSSQILSDLQSELYRLCLLIQYGILSKHEQCMSEQHNTTLALLTVMQSDRGRRLTRSEFLRHSKRQKDDLLQKKILFSFDPMDLDEHLPPILKGEWLKCPAGHVHCQPVVTKALREARRDECPQCAQAPN